MNEHNRKTIWALIQKTGDELQAKLKPSSSHPKGRNAYAHISLCIKEKFGVSYKELDDDQTGVLIDYIDFMLKNPD